MPHLNNVKEIAHQSGSALEALELSCVAGRPKPVGYGAFDLRKRVLALSLVVLLVPITTEGLLRLRQLVKYGTFRLSPYQLKFDPTSGLSIPVPGRQSRSIWINSSGFRSPEIALPKPRGTIRVAFLGASAAFCAEVTSNDATWPSQVMMSLHKSWPATQFDYINAAIPALSTAESLRNLIYRVKPYNPDVIVLYEGDLTQDTRRLAEQQGLPTGRIGDQGTLAQWSLAWNLLQTNLRRMSRVRNVQSTRRLKFDAKMLDDGEFPKQLRELVNTAKSISPVVAIATLSIKPRREQPADQQLTALQWAIYYMPYMTPLGIMQGYDEYNHIITSVAEETSATLIANENSIPGDDEHFKDAVHFTDLGCVRMSARITAALSASLEFKHLIDEHSR